MIKQLIVNADDYGRTPGVTRGILRAHQRGIVTSTTVMMNMPYASESLRLAEEYPRLRVGVHLVFTSHYPILPPEEIPSLVHGNGTFYRPEELMERVIEVDLGQLRAELRAQVELFLSTKRRPTHLDCHHGVYLYPPLFAVHVELAKEFGLPMRVPLSPPETFAGREIPTIAPDLPPDKLFRFLAEDWRLVQEAGVSHPDHFVGRFFGAEALTVERLLRILEELPPGITEMMTHPGLADEQLLRESSYAVERERELELLCHPQVREKVAELDIELVNFSVLA
ncbi:MAG TPA: carbohydrate deacetylase [Anaerolineae bacterium]|nr:carbohydrate deacetylase [Anaerolineae bacterium]